MPQWPSLKMLWNSSRQKVHGIEGRYGTQTTKATIHAFDVNGLLAAIGLQFKLWTLAWKSIRAI